MSEEAPTGRHVLHLRDESDPEARGRVPGAGEHRWTLRVPLDDGRELHLHMGDRGRDAILGMLTRAVMDDANEQRRH